MPKRNLSRIKAYQKVKIGRFPKDHILLNRQKIYLIMRVLYSHVDCDNSHKTSVIGAEFRDDVTCRRLSLSIVKDVNDVHSALLIWIKVTIFSNVMLKIDIMLKIAVKLKIAIMLKIASMLKIAIMLKVAIMLIIASMLKIAIMLKVAIMLKSCHYIQKSHQVQNSHLIEQAITLRI